MFNRTVYPFLVACFCLVTSCISAQEQKIADSLAKLYQQNNLSDTAKLNLLSGLSFNESRDLKKGLKYAEELISLAEQRGYDDYLRIGYFLKGTKKRLLGDLDDALDAYIKSIEIARKLKLLKVEGETYGAIADIYSVANNFNNAINYYHKSIFTLRQPPADSISLASVLSNAGDVFLRHKNYDSALIYFREANDIFEKVGDKTGIAYSIGNIGMVYASTGKNILAENNINEAIAILEETQDYYPICVYLISMADIYLEKGDIETALNYTLRSFRLAEQSGLKEQVAEASLKLSELYERKGNISESYKYFKKHIANRDSISNIQSVQKLADLRHDYEFSQKQLEVNLLNDQKSNQKKLVFSLAIILSLAIFILFILLKNNQNKQKAYRVLSLQKQETELQKSKAEDALNELQLTQRQLIQSAKMASLGELTAGIAHEIKNPLNFVNNFSEVSVELLGELRADAVNKLSASDKEEAESIINTLEDNLRKILSHGQRADSIVKGMLQHSRASSSKKEQTDINGLAGEYLRLSYHGLSAKDKLLVHSTTEFDTGIESLAIVRQDIGSVLLNLINNAFYAVLKKKEQETDGYDPVVSITTRKRGNMIELSVKDNGIGIPQNIIDKIFQPFYTTKPTGQGTGLGLSLSYDIIKAHGGELKVETKEGEYAEFIIQLPIGNPKASLT